MIGERNEEERRKVGGRKKDFWRKATDYIQYVTSSRRLRKLTNPITQLFGMHPLCQELSFNQGSNFHLRGEGRYLCRTRTQRQALRMDTGLILASTKITFIAPAFPQRISTAAVTPAHTTRHL